MKMEDAIKIAFQKTEETNSEVLFTYDPETRKITSAIIIGDPFHGVPMPFVHFGEKGGISNPKAVFHTHPGKNATWDDKIKDVQVTESKECNFSTLDFETDFVNDSKTEMMLGCPSTGDLLTLRRGDIPMDDMIRIIVRLFQNKKDEDVVGEGMNRVNMISWKLKSKFPNIEKDIEDIRKSYFDDAGYFTQASKRIKADYEKIAVELNKLIDKHAKKEKI